MPGGLLNIISVGNNNLFLTGNPSKTFFKTTYAKYSNFGLLNKYYKPRIKFEASIMKMPFEDYDPIAGNGGLTNDVLTYFIDNVFGQYIKFSDNILESPENNYTLYKTNISLNDLLLNIEKYKIKTASDNKKYRLVGIVYDCPDGVTHQITSLCYGDNCIKTPPTHTFHDDQLIKSKNIASPFNKSDLQWGCKTNMNIQNLLYENEDAIQILQSALIGEDFFDTIRAGITIHGGFKNNVNYYEKYIKYKQKYLSLKNKN
jgi:hypothetical protein